MNLIGHQAQQQQLTQQRLQQCLPHAILLHGPSGIGKSLFAHEFAIAFLCESNQIEPCGQCKSCHMFTGESHPDFLSIGRTYNDKNIQNRDINVSQIRSLLHFITLTGTRSQRRVVILDDADRMNHQAANALLKGLEEPTDACLLLLVCENMQRLPVTIRSRCLGLPFGPLSTQECHQIFLNMNMQEQHFSLAQDIANGQPGKVKDFCQDKKAQALHQLSQLVQQPFDILAWQTWIDQHLSTLSLPIIVDIIRQPYMKKLSQITCFKRHQALSQALWCLACWPERLRTHSLRPAPSLLAHVLHLENVLTQK